MDLMDVCPLEMPEESRSQTLRVGMYRRMAGGDFVYTRWLSLAIPES